MARVGCLEGQVIVAVRWDRSAVAEVEAAGELEGEGAADVGEVGGDLEVAAVPAGEVRGEGEGGAAEGFAGADLGGRVVDVGDELAEPGFELALEGGAVVPAADAFALDALEVVGEAADEEEVGELGGEVVGAEEGGCFADDGAAAGAVDGDGEEAGADEVALEA